MASLYNLNSILSLRKIGNIVKPIMVVFSSFAPTVENIAVVIGENYGF